MEIQRRDRRSAVPVPHRRRQPPFINVASITQSVITTIPTTGDHAFVANEWFHAAVAYNGEENTPDNIKLYWTRVSNLWTEANEIHSDSMLQDLGGVSTTFGAGQEYRSPSDNLEGQIDEVRISSIARAPDEFLFLAPDTDADGLADPWEILHFRDNPGETEAEILAKYDGTDDPDNDTFHNEAEETAGTDPNDDTHTPLDADQDGYLDSWELANFGTIAYGPADDPTATAGHHRRGTHRRHRPGQRSPTPDDTDADGMDDATEIALFKTSTRARSTTSTATASPTSANSRPAPTRRPERLPRWFPCSRSPTATRPPTRTATPAPPSTRSPSPRTT
jgi:hypothetical protein